jgi:hypothetical protein
VRCARRLRCGGPHHLAPDCSPGIGCGPAMRESCCFHFTDLGAHHAKSAGAPSTTSPTEHWENGLPSTTGSRIHALPPQEAKTGFLSPSTANEHSARWPAARHVRIAELIWDARKRCRGTRRLAQCGVVNDDQAGTRKVPSYWARGRDAG